jgi:hypothetical protein
MANDDRPPEERRISGIVTGFDQYRTSADAPDQAQSPHEYTLIDFYNALRKLLQLLDKIQLERIENLINAHIYNYTNPHKDTLESLGIDILNELFKIWLSTHPTTDEISFEFFIKLLFQYVEVASVEEALTNKYPNKLISVLDLLKIIEQHNNDPNAHANLMERLIPGEPVGSCPIVAWHSFYALPRTKVIPAPYNTTQIRNILNERYTAVIHDPNQFYIQSDGKAYKLKNTDLPIEWIDHNPYFSLWRASSNVSVDGYNLIDYSEDFTKWALGSQDGIMEKVTHQSISSVFNAYIEGAIIDPSDPVYAYYIGEKKTPTTSLHGVTTTSSYQVEAGSVYTFSIFVKSASYSKQAFYIKFTHDQLDNTYRFAHYDLNPLAHQTYQIHEDISNIKMHAYILPMAHNWCRCVLSMKFPSAGNIRVSCGPLDNYGGNLEYSNNTEGGHTVNNVLYGGGSNGIYICGAQLERNTSASPYMKTKGTAYKRSCSSSIIIPFNSQNKMSFSQGTFFVSYLNYNILQDNRFNTAEIAKMRYDDNASMIIASTQALNDQYVFKSTYRTSSNNNIILDLPVHELEHDVLIQQALSFNYRYGVDTCLTDFISTKLISNSNTRVEANRPAYRYNTTYPYFILGDVTSNVGFNGYIQSIVYYPEHIDSTRIRSLIDYTQTTE